MRQEITERRKTGPKAIWDDPQKLQELYTEFGGEDNFDELLDTLSWTGDWGDRATRILRARLEGNTLEEIAAVLGIAHENVWLAERRGLQALYEMRDNKLVALPRLAEGKGAKSIWNNPRGIMEQYGGEQVFNNLLHKLEAIESPQRPRWGKRLVSILLRLMSGEFPSEIAGDYGLNRHRIGALGYQALEALDILAKGEELKLFSHVEVLIRKRLSEIFQQFGSEEKFWKLIQMFEDIFWEKLDEKKYHEAWQVAEGLAILRAKAEGKSNVEIGRALGTEAFPLTKARVQQITAWALDNLNCLQRGEEVQFRAPSGNSFD